MENGGAKIDRGTREVKSVIQIVTLILSKQNMTLINHGMGLTEQKEHDELVSINAIVCHQGRKNDAICADYPKLVVRDKNDEKTIDCGGNLTALQGELAVAQSNHKIAFIAYFPRAYFNYMGKKWARDKAYDDQQEAIEALG